MTGAVVVPVDLGGRLLPGYRVVGAPDCVELPYRCQFISADSAVRIAKARKFPRGIAPWRIDFVWAEDPGLGGCYYCRLYFDSFHAPVYAWRISSRRTRWSGEILGIDAATGLVLGRHQWVQ